jgi:hypothetical protein
VVRAQTSLLRFSRVSGEVFSRARTTILDVAAALGTDLETAAFSVGRALERPSQGIRQLRALGVVFTEDQQKLITRMEETGRIAEAQALILKTLEDRYSGAAKAARNTLGGALEGLKNALGDLFESTNDGANKAAEGINEVTDVLSDPKLRSAVQGFVGESLKWLAAFSNLIAKSVEGWQFLLGFVVKETPSAIDQLYDKQSKLGASLDAALDQRERARRGGDKVREQSAQRVIDRAQAEIKKVESQLKSAGQAGKPFETGKDAARRKGSGLTFVSSQQLDQEAADRMAAALAQLEAFDPSATKIELQGINKLMREFEESTQTSGERASREFESLKIKLNELGVSAETYNKRVQEFIDANLELIDVTAIRAKKLEEPLSKAQQSIKNFTDTVKAGLENAAERGKFSFRDLSRFIIAELTKRELFKAIDALGAALNKALSPSGGGKGGLLGSIFGFFGGLFRAGGGQAKAGDIVGEDGPELLMSNGQVFNRRQLAFAGSGGGGVSVVNHNTFQISEAASPEKVAAYVETRLAQTSKKNAEAFARVLKDNGMGRLR